MISQLENIIRLGFHAIGYVDQSLSSEERKITAKKKITGITAPNIWEKINLIIKL